jgi:hypothetical protein
MKPALLEGRKGPRKIGRCHGRKEVSFMAKINAAEHIEG